MQARQFTRSDLAVRNELSDYSAVFAEVLSWVCERRGVFPPGYPFYIELNSMAEWADALRTPGPEPSSEARYIVTSALESDVQRMEILRQHGFRPTRHFEPVLTCDLTKLDIPDPPAAFAMRHVQEGDFAARVAVHAAAWVPATGFNMERYLRVRAMSEVFDPELDIVAVAEDGTFASYTIAWQDPVSRIGSFEPFGTRPEYRGSGVSRAVLYEGFRRLIRKGMRFARIYTAGFNHQAAKLYQSCGFTRIDVNRTLMKQL